MGRNAKSIDLHLADGNPNRLTKAEIEARRQAEVKLGATDFKKLKPPAFVENDVVAFRYWKQHIKEYKEAAEEGIEILTTADIGQLALYCKSYSDYENLLKMQNDKHELNDALKLQTSINKKMDMLLKMQDRLFLNPLARVKNVPKREPKKPVNPMEEEFDV
jgi:phage terminase small subunit